MPSHPPLASNGRQLSLEKFKNKSNKIQIWTIPALDVMPGMNSAANFTPIKLFSDLKLVFFMLYTYNKQTGRWD